ncbi:MAG TPA: polysaccharide pyruvyl transferase family protein [Longimicrobiaceae bacterium]|nr:polysaccharide pyruvyl transferase family protein [Longimicrobiaceae bacterium]
MTAPEFGLLDCGSANLGDEIQALAARRFLPRVDRLVARERLDADPGGEGTTRVILNGWFMHDPRRWPPHEKIAALPISMHLSSVRPSWRTPRHRIPARVLLSRHNLAWLHRHGPVGARDPHTLELLTRRGIEAWYSGCLTLTLPPRDRSLAGERVVACGLGPEVVAGLARRTRHPPVAVDHVGGSVTGAGERMERAAELLDMYAAARLVVTSRVHCALPCLAMGTPVLFVRTAHDPTRQRPAVELARHVTARELMDGRVPFDCDDPPPNPEAWRAFVPELVRRCEAFVSA